MKRMPKQPKAKHGVFGILLGLATLVVPGFLAIVVGALRDVLPVEWLQYREPFTEHSARGLALVLGVGLPVVAKGYFSFQRLGWLGYVVWALVGVVTLVGSIRAETATTVIELFPILVILGLPYLWVRGRSFGIGPQPNVGGR